VDSVPCRRQSFRPVAHPWLVKSAYGVSWVYLTTDVANEGWKAYRKQYGRPEAPAKEGGRDYREIMAQRAVFQGVASMGLPALTIHSVVRYSGRAMSGMRNVRVRTWAPIGLGLAVVPFLPLVIDEPVEKAVDWCFEKGREVLVGKEGKVKEL